MTDEQYQEMMGKIHMAGKISSGSGDMPVSDEEQLRRLNAALKVGLIKKVDPIEKFPGIDEAFSMEGQDKYIKDMEQVNKNTEEMLKLGIPLEKLQPFINRKTQESAMMGNLDRRYAPSPRDNPLFISEERSLGLNPENYTKKPWNSGDYINPMKSAVEEMRQSQELVLGPEPEQLTAEEQSLSNRARLKQLMGY